MKTTANTNATGIVAIYVRRSVGDKDNVSFSIDSQISECIKSVREGEDYEVYNDGDKSGKNVEKRPDFMRLVSDVREGHIKRIIVKKYDRFSRNMRDYLNITNMFDSYGVGVVSTTQDFNTETIEGRMMRNNILNFAEYERETIALRVADAYNTKSMETGFYLGGQTYYGYTYERRIVNGKKGSVLIPSDKAEVIKTAYQLYRSPNTSLQDLMVYFRENEIQINRPSKNSKKEHTNMDRSHFSTLLESPLYVRADKAVYEFLVSKGYNMVDDISAYDGIHGLFRHRKDSEDKYIKVGYHEGLVDAETWLAVQDKKSHNTNTANNGQRVKHSWLVGLLKCEYCNFAVNIKRKENKTNNKQRRYYLDSGAYKSDGCLKKRLTTRPDYVEELVFKAMKERINALEIAKREKRKPDTETEKLKAEKIRCDDEIRKLMEKLADADEVLFDYIQSRVKSIHEKKLDIVEKLNKKTRKHKEIDTAPLSDPMNRWEELTVEEKHTLAVTMIDKITISDENGVNIKFSI